MKEAWLMAGAVVPVDVETTSELVAEIKRLIDVVGGMALAQQEPDWKAEYLKSVESGCITLDELREANAELAATNRQVEILSDALAESRREVAAQSAPVQATMKLESSGPGHGPAPNQKLSVRHVSLIDAGKTPPVQPAVPDAIGPNEDELPAYAAGWNDCRAEMLKGMK